MYEAEQPAIDTAAELVTDDRGPWMVPDCLYLQVGIERGDSIGTGRVSHMVKEICRTAKAVGVATVLVHAVAGIADSDRRAEVAEAMIVTAALVARLTAASVDGAPLEVHVAPFGWHKRLTPMDIIPGVWEQRWLETSRTPFLREAAALAGATFA